MTGSCPVGADVCREAHAEVERLRLISARLYDVATFALPHIYEGLCPDPQQPDKRDPSCDACNALIVPNEGEKR